MTQESLHIRQIPEGVKNNFKAACASLGVSMTEATIAFMNFAAAHEDWLLKLIEEDDEEYTKKPNNGGS